MEESVWDKYWKKQSKIAVKDIINNDPYYRLLKRLLELPQNKGLRILEVGCGSGTRTLALLKDFEEHHLNAVCVDISLPALSFAKMSADNNKITADFIVSDAFKLPFPDETFDIVWNGGVNEHFAGEKRQKIFDEMARVCKEGGKMVVIVPNALNLPYRVTKKILEMRNLWEYGFEKPFTVLELNRRVRDAGVMPTKSGGFGVLSSFFDFMQLFSKQPKGQDERSNERKSERSRYPLLKQLFRQIEGICEILFGSLFAKNIGVGGVKRDKNNDRTE